jgi:hypothetical protein
MQMELSKQCWLAMNMGCDDLTQVSATTVFEYQLLEKQQSLGG